jgi:CDGSH-type Zn-finger protein
MRIQTPGEVAMRFQNDKSAFHPLERVLQPGTYYWCRCGKTAMPPYCDGKHVGSDVTPLQFRITTPKGCAICNCGLTATPPYCDGAHTEL